MYYIIGSIITIEKTPEGVFSIVAGPGVEPGSPGYEPDEVPFL